jgi:two-component system, NarL family, invasion response regulator UvrY
MTVDSGIGLEPDRTTRVGVMVVDDQAVFRRAARAVIDATAGFEPVGDAGSGLDALRHADELRPDLVLMDVHMPGMDGLEATRRLTESHPKCVVVLVSLDTFDDAGAVAASCGAADFLRKQELKPAVLRGLWSTHGPHE